MSRGLQRFSSITEQRGQVGIIVLLVAAVALVVGLTIANRSTQEVSSNLEQEDSSRIFNIAEGGIEEALNNIFQAEKNGTPIQTQNNQQTDQAATSVSIDLAQQFEGYLQPGEVVQVNVTNGATGTLTINWSKDSCPAAGLLITHYYQSGGVYQNDSYLVGNCATYADQKLIPPTLLAPSSSNPYYYRYQVTLNTTNNTGAFLRIYPVTSGTDLNIGSTNGNLITSQYTITSLAQSETGSSAKAIELSRSMPAAPAFMDFSLVSGGSISK